MSEPKPLAQITAITAGGLTNLDRQRDQVTTSRWRGLIFVTTHASIMAQIDGKTAFVFAGGGSLGAIQIGMLVEVERYTRAAEQERLARQAIRRQARNKNKSGKPDRREVANLTDELITINVLAKKMALPTGIEPVFQP
jgi:hypothetical protein